MNKKLVAIYLRVSSDEQKTEGLSLDAQKRKIEGYIKERGWEIFKIYSDAGISGKSIKGRKSFQEMIEDAKNKKFSTILITKFDRSFRNVKDAITILDELNSIGIDFVSLAENIDTTTPFGRLLFVFISALAELERNLTVVRVKDIMRDKFLRGMMVGKSPFGYKYLKTKGMVIDEKKAEIVKDMFKMVIEKKNYKEICEKHNLKPQSFYNIIRNPVYCGYIKFENQIKKGIHEIIIPEEIFKKLNPEFKDDS